MTALYVLGGAVLGVVGVVVLLAVAWWFAVDGAFKGMLGPSGKGE